MLRENTLIQRKSSKHVLAEPKRQAGDELSRKSNHPFAWIHIFNDSIPVQVPCLTWTLGSAREDASIPRVEDDGETHEAGLGFAQAVPRSAAECAAAANPIPLARLSLEPGPRESRDQHD